MGNALPIPPQTIWTLTASNVVMTFAWCGPLMSLAHLPGIGAAHSMFRSA